MAGIFTGVLTGISGILRRKFELLVMAVVCIMFGVIWYFHSETPFSTPWYNIVVPIGIVVILMGFMAFFAHMARKEDKEIVDEATINEGIKLASERMYSFLTTPPNPTIEGNIPVTSLVSIRLKTTSTGRYASIIVNGKVLPNSRMKIG